MSFTKVKNIAYQSLKTYPTLFLKDTLEKSILQIYDHLFFVGGNGYKWLMSSKGLYYLQEPIGERVLDEDGDYVEYILLPTVNYDENEPEVSDFDLKALHESLWRDYLDGKPPFELEARLIKMCFDGGAIREIDEKLARACELIKENQVKERQTVSLYPVSESAFRVNWGDPMIDLNQLAPDWKEALQQLTEYALNNLEVFNRPELGSMYRENLGPKEFVLKIHNVLKNGGSLND
jgi:hypothetical protein